ncbi:MAG: hypothetical protein B6I20_14495 [Bacteroidetes bacterium 4572_117]|nr:MAG: hypothetical protein B6I20_14495 [Bacteroidetes bacterium 4572_117]
MKDIYLNQKYILQLNNLKTMKKLFLNISLIFLYYSVSAQVEIYQISPSSIESILQDQLKNTPIYRNFGI